MANPHAIPAPGLIQQALVISSRRELAQAIRGMVLSLLGPQVRVDVELDALRVLQLLPQSYDLILLDAVLDVMDGWQLLTLLKQRAPKTQFVALCDDLGEASLEMAREHGADLFLPRPVSPQTREVAIESLGRFLDETAQKRGLSTSATLEVVDLREKLEQFGANRQTGRLRIKTDAGSGDLFLVHGEIFQARTAELDGVNALREIGRWAGAPVRMQALVLPDIPERKIDLPLAKLLSFLDGHSLSAPDELAGEVTPDLLAGLNPEVIAEAPPFVTTTDEPVTSFLPPPASGGGTERPEVNSHWKINLMGELVEGSQMADPARCALITDFFYRKLADIAVVLDTDYFETLTLIGPHLHQVVLATHLGVHHAVFESAWSDEAQRNQFIKWCREQSL